MVMVAHHSMVHPGREEGVNVSRVDQLSVVCKDGPEEQNHKLQQTSELKHSMTCSVRRCEVDFISHRAHREGEDREEQVFASAQRTRRLFPGLQIAHSSQSKKCHLQ